MYELGFFQAPTVRSTWARSENIGVALIIGFQFV